MPAHTDQCSVGQHPQGQVIDQALASGDSYRLVADRYALSETAVCRHVTWTKIQAAHREAATQQRQAARQLQEQALALH